jgi:hypothetical protein
MVKRDTAFRWSLALNVVLGIVILANFQGTFLRNALNDNTGDDASAPAGPHHGGAAAHEEEIADAEGAVASAGKDSGMPFLTKPYGMLRTRHKRSMLATVQPLWYTTPGLGYIDGSNNVDLRDTLILPAGATRVCIDVGTYVSTPSSKRWWSLDPNTFVIAFEPNYFSSAMLTRLANPTMHDQGRGYWPTCTSITGKNQIPNATTGEAPKPVHFADYVHDCVDQNLAHVTKNYKNFLLIPVALSYRNEFATFMVGFPGRPDGGSLLTFRPKIRKRNDPPSRIQIGIAPLYPYLRMIPAYTTPKNTGPNSTRVLWDTLKIDAQGVDELVIEGGGHLLAHFACVIAELDIRSYNAGHRFEYQPFMVGVLKFIRIGRNTFINPRFRQEFLDNRVLCTAPDVHHTKDDILKALGESKV